MAESNSSKRERWLVAAWPGMGNVGLMAAGYLLERLGASKVAELEAREFFEVHNLDVQKGLAGPGRLPRSMFFEWTGEGGRPDLLIFVGEAQPAVGGYRLCEQVLNYAAQHGVKRLCTFAAMATQLQLGTPPRVFAVATGLALLNRVRQVGAEVLEEGQIGGLNGVLLAAGAERGMEGMCLLGEMPFFAAAVPNPRAAKAVLECFGSLAEIELDLAALSAQADLVDEKLGQLMDQMIEAASQAAEEVVAEQEEEEAPEAQAGQATAEAAPKPKLDRQAQRRVEKLFEEARQDRSKAFKLKHELDRLGVFKDYEDRFLDLFRKGE